MSAARGCNRCIIHTCVLAKKVGGARAPSAPLVPTPMLHTGNIVVQLSKSFKDGSKFLLLNKVNEALENDPDLHGVPQQYRLQALQSLYVCTGCDYVAGMGKVSFLSTFFQYAAFIVGGLEAPASIGDISLHAD